MELDSAEGAHEGGQIAAPVFKRVAQQVLAYLNVPHDIPISADTLRASRQKWNDRNLADVSDFDPVQADASTAPEDSVPAANPQDNGSAAPTVELAEGNGIPVPQLQGRTVREVIEQCMKFGFTPILAGTGIAIEQSPEPGTMIRRGSHIRVRFARDASLVSASARRTTR